MRRSVGIAVGALAGVTLAGAGLAVVARASDGLLGSEAVVLVATPAAYVVSWISGWPMEQEAALLCYAVGIVATALVVGGVLGAIAGAIGTGDRARSRARGEA